MVPFTGTTPLVNAIVARQIDYGCDPVLGPVGQIRAGNVKAIAVAAKARSALVPDVRTSYEQGVPAFDCAPGLRHVRAEGHAEGRGGQDWPRR